MLRTLKHEGRFSLERWKKYFYNEAGKTVTQVAQRCSISGKIHGQVRQGSEQSDLKTSLFTADDLLSSLQHKPFHDSMCKVFLEKRQNFWDKDPYKVIFL